MFKKGCRGSASKLGGGTAESAQKNGGKKR